MKKTLKIFAAILFGARLAGESHKYAVDRQYFMLEMIFVISILTFFSLMVYLLF